MEQDNKVENQLEEETKDTPKEQNPGCPKSYLLHFNISKQKNFGRLVRSAAAFGVSEIFVVNSGKGKLDLFGHQGTAKHTQL